MHPTAPRATLVLADGTALPVTPRGLLLGRGLGVDVPLVDPAASRRHALVFLDGQGPCLVQLGRVPVRVNGLRVDQGHRLAHRDRIELPGFQAEIRLLEGSPSPASWVAQVDGTWAGIPAEGLVLGHPAPTGWPPETARLRGDGAGLTVQVLGGGSRASLRVNEDPLPVGERRALASGDTLRLGATVVRIMAVSTSTRTTAASGSDTRPWRLVLQPLPPAGGQATFSVGQDEVAVFVPGFRFDLLQTLARPPEGGRCGDWLADGAAVTRVWGRESPDDPTALNTLTKRLRNDLRSAGLDGGIVERVAGRTRLVLAPGAAVELLAAR